MEWTKTQGLRWVARALAALAVLLAMQMAFQARRPNWRTADSAARRPAAVPALFRWPVLEASQWKTLRSEAARAPVPAAGSLAARYRLAGVFLILTDPEEFNPQNRCAILDDRESQQQILAAEGEAVGSVRVKRVASDHVVLSDGDHQEAIYLAAGTLPGSGPAGSAAPAEEGLQILESNRFGNRVGDARWEFSREAVLGYYQEMLDNPERLAALFLAMEADRDEAGKVAGYRLNMDVGEREFYTQVGLQQGDVIRKVNSMRMTSQRRAEFFIGEFVQGRLGAVVLDIERNGEAKKLIYLIK